MNDFDAAPPQENTASSQRAWPWRRDLIIGVAVFLVVVLPSLYFTGMLNRGYESRHVSFGGFASSNNGMSLGLKSMHLESGNEFVVDYDATVHRGGLMIYLHKRKGMIGGDMVGMERITSSGAGQVVIPIEEPGYYTLRISGSPGGEGYDVSYSASWTVR